ncbi:hypothetical protein R1sor_004238 [Riccia sorocarpa]|uniref:Amino acid transporter transmembrane domain-containing protein n=1 Tax=Riccia sorocarpa TaxID=122646 RepID=A0ABD3H7X2_9MARC
MVAVEAERNELPMKPGAQKFEGPRYQESLTKDAGALFVLESKGNWQHAGFHLTTSIAGPTLLSLPYAFAGLGWEYGPIMLVLGALVTFYAYNFFAFNGDRGACCKRSPSSSLPGLGRRHYRPMVRSWCCFPPAVCTLRRCSNRLHPPWWSLYEGHSDKAPPRDYGLQGTETQKIFGAFNSLSVIAVTYGNGIIPEIQGTLAPPVTGKMFKGLIVCYAVVCSTFFSVSFSGYWAFGNLASGNIFSNFQLPDGTSLVPDWLIVLPNAMVILQLVPITVVYCQPTFDILEGKTADVKQARFALRNWFPRLVFRTTFLCLTILVAAMFPFFGDVAAILGAFGCTPLDFVFPMLFYIVLFKPPKTSVKFWGNLFIIVVYGSVGLVGAVAAIRQLVLDTSMYKLFADI